MTPKQNKALAALLTASSKTEAAQAAGISPRTLRDYFADPVFRQEYQKAFSGLIEDATRQAQRTIAPALAALQEILENNEESAQARISASRSILEFSLKLTEATDILMRLDDLERHVVREQESEDI